MTELCSFFVHLYCELLSESRCASKDNAINNVNNVIFCVCVCLCVVVQESFREEPYIDFGEIM